MRFTLHLLLIALFVVFACATAPMKQIIVSYPKGTPDAVVEKAKVAIKEAGGFITHEYNLFIGFAASTPAKMFDTIKTMGAEHNAVVEEDQVVSIASPGH